LSGLKKAGRDETGAMLIEMAVVLPTFFMLLFGIFSFSIALFGRGNAICAANEAARYASVHSATALVPSSTASVKSYAAGFLYAAPTAGTVISTTYSAGNVVGGTVTVTVSVTYSTGIPFYGIHNVTVTGSSQRTISR
jgi:Flp pilus assembly protein TadG